MATKFKLDPNPTFSAAVDIPIHGGGVQPVGFTFKHRTREDMKELFSEQDGKDDVETLMAIVEGWELDDKFNADNVKRLLENYQGSGAAIVRKYMMEITQARLGN